MSFEIKPLEEADSRDVKEFVDAANPCEDSGHLSYRLNEDLYDTFVVYTDDKIVGEADRLVNDELVMAGCFILPEFRGKLSRDGKSCFQVLAEKRIEEGESARVNATLGHAKSQHIYQKLGFEPVKFEPAHQDFNSPRVQMVDKSSEREVGEVYLPEPTRDFVKDISDRLELDVKFLDSDQEGYSITDLGSNSSSPADYNRFNISPGILPLLEVEEQLPDEDLGRFSFLSADISEPQAYRFVESYLDKGYEVSGLDIGPNQNTKIEMIDSNFEDDIEAISKVQRFLQNTGLETDTVEYGEKSYGMEIS